MHTVSVQLVWSNYTLHLQEINDITIIVGFMPLRRNKVIIGSNRI